jgi:hypothetical protein
MKDLFRKIFDLDPNEVEEFVKNLMIEHVKRNSESEEEALKYLKDYDVVVRWIVTDNSFYVFLDPKLETEDYKHFYFKDKKELTAGDYFTLSFNHEHYEFPEVYGLMTGETTFVEEIGICGEGDIQKMLRFIYKKQSVTVIYVKDIWLLQKWEGDKEIREPLPNDLLAVVCNTRV